MTLYHLISIFFSTPFSVKFYFLSEFLLLWWVLLDSFHASKELELEVILNERYILLGFVFIPTWCILKTWVSGSFLEVCTLMIILVDFSCFSFFFFKLLIASLFVYFCCVGMLVCWCCFIFLLFSIFGCFLSVLFVWLLILSVGSVHCDFLPLVVLLRIFCFKCFDFPFLYLYDWWCMFVSELLKSNLKFRLVQLVLIVTPKKFLFL